MAKKVGAKEAAMKAQREAAASANEGTKANSLFDLSAYMTELNEFKESKRKPIETELAKVMAEIEELQLKASELHAILDKIDGFDRSVRSKPSRARSTSGGGRSSGGGVIDSIDDEKIIAAVGDKQYRDGRGIIAQRVGVDVEDKKMLLKVGARLVQLAADGKIGTEGTGRGTIYFKL